MLDKFAEQIKLIIRRSGESVYNFKELVNIKRKNMWSSLLVKLQVLIAVMKLQLNMLKMKINCRYTQLTGSLDAYAHECSDKLQQRYEMCRKVWHANQHFTFWLIPADGSHIAKKHVKKTHLKYAFSEEHGHCSPFTNLNSSLILPILMFI